MPISLKPSLLALCVICALQLSAQTYQSRCIIDLEAGVGNLKFFNEPYLLADHAQIGPGKNYQLAVERIIKGRYGIGLQLSNTIFTCHNNSMASDEQERLSNIPKMRNISSDQSFGVSQSCLLVSGSFIKQIEHWQFESSLSCGLGLMNYNSMSQGFVPDSTKSGSFFFISSGTAYAYSIECSRYMTARAQISLRYVLNPNDKTSVAFFAGLGLGYQRVKMEHVLQNGPETLLGPRFEHFQTGSVWQQNISNVNLRAGISIILNKKVD